VIGERRGEKNITKLLWWPFHLFLMSQNLFVC
jgi:hypothetical protein